MTTNEAGERLDSREDSLTEAQAMTEWFPDYLYGALEKPGQIPLLTKRRLERQFGLGDNNDQLAILKDQILTLPDEHQSNVASYICGYPDEALELLSDGNMSESIKFLDSLIAPPTVDLSMPDDLAPGETMTDRRLRIRSESASEPVPTTQLVTRQPSLPAQQQYKSSSLPPKSTSSFSSVSLGAGEYDPEDLFAWQSDALCAQTNPEAFFPEKGGSTKDAKKICASCEVRSECLEYALGNDERFGIWGGLSERERRRLRKNGQPACAETVRTQ